MKKIAFLNPITLAVRGVKPVLVSARDRVRKASDYSGLAPRSAAYVALGMAEVLGDPGRLKVNHGCEARGI